MSQAETTARFLLRHGLHLATAESCTAGLIASRIAEVPGCGETLRCAIVAYSPQAKTEILSVPAETIRRHGLTSEQVSLAMARGAMQLIDAEVVIANTGVADDNGGDDTAPGTQCFAWIFRPGNTGRLPVEFTETRRFTGERNAVREAAANWALARVGHYYEMACRHDAAQASQPGPCAP